MRGNDIMRLAAGPSAIGRSIIAPPGLPPDRAAALRQVFQELASDPEFTAESARRMAMRANVVAGLRAIAEGREDEREGTALDLIESFAKSLSTIWGVQL